MAVDVTPYLEIAQFAAMFGRTLSATETALATTLLLPASGVTIRNAFALAGKEPPDINDPMAKLVTFDLVSTALAVPAQYLGHTAYERSTDDRVESGTLAAVAAMLDLTDHHRIQLGLSAAAAPTYGGFDGFGGGDPWTGSHGPYVDQIAGAVYGDLTFGVVAVGEIP